MRTRGRIFERQAVKWVWYQYTCEKCGKLHRGQAKFTATSSVRRFRTPKQKEFAFLQQQAEQHLSDRMLSAQKELAQGKVPGEIEGCCSHCDKRQRWSWRHTAAKVRAAYWTCLVVGIWAALRLSRPRYGLGGNEWSIVGVVLIAGTAIVLLTEIVTRLLAWRRKQEQLPELPVIFWD